MKYGVKVLYTYSVGKDNRYFYETQILSVEAQSFDEAYTKAEAYLSHCEKEHMNPHNETVKTEKIEIIDCFSAFDEDGDIQEIYSCVTRNQSPLSEQDFYSVITHQCDDDEMFILRYKEFN